MGSVSYPYTFTGTETMPGEFFHLPIQNWTGNFTITVGLSTAHPGSILNFVVVLYNDATSSVCFNVGMALLETDIEVSGPFTVGIPSGAWPCFDWTSVIFAYSGSTHRAPTGSTVTLTFTGPDIGEVVAAIGLTQVSILG